MDSVLEHRMTTMKCILKPALNPTPHSSRKLEPAPKDNSNAKANNRKCTTWQVLTMHSQYMNV